MPVGCEVEINSVAVPALRVHGGMESETWAVKMHHQRSGQSILEYRAAPFHRFVYSNSIYSCPFPILIIFLN